MRLFDYPRATRLMSERGVDMVLATTRPSVGYLSDYWDDDTRDDYAMWYPDVFYATMCGVPADERQGAFIVLSGHEKTAAEAKSLWITDRRYWGPGFYVQQWRTAHPAPGHPTDEAIAAIKDRNLERSRIAVERQHIKADHFERLKEALPAVKWVDAYRLIADMKAVKTPEEVRRLRTVCERTVTVWKRIMADLKPGMTELDVRWRFVEEFAVEHVSWERGYILFGPSGVRLQGGAPVAGKNVLKPGLFVRADVVARHEGYLSDMSRVIGYGQVSPEMERAHAAVRRILEQLTKEIRPGVPVRQIRKMELELYAEAGFKPVVPYAAHSIGFTVHEAPYVSEWDATVLERGMVISLEPTVTFSQGGEINICLEDDLLVTESGCENLTASATQDLYPEL